MMSRLALLALVCLVSPCFAAEEWPVPRGPSREPDEYKFDAKSLKRLSKAMLDDNVAIILYSGSTYRVEADGTIEHTSHEATRLGGRKAVEKLGEFRNITYTPSYQKVVLHLARIHKASGKVVNVEPRHVHLRDVATDFSTYDADKQLIISFPGLDVGDVVEVKWTVRGKNPEHAGQFFQRYSFGDTDYPLLMDDLRVLLAKGKDLKYLLRQGVSDVKVERTEKMLGDMRYFRWSAKDCPRPPQDENLPSREEMRPTLSLSTFASWEAVGLWKHKLRTEVWKCTPVVRKATEDIIKGLKTPREKARALTYWVRRNLRYLAAGEKHDYTPHPPEKVLTSRFGDCKDTSQMLAVMMREAGLKVELVTLGVHGDGQVEKDVPSPWGTHGILAVTIDGKLHWVDTTARLNGWDELPSDDLDRLCYLTDENGKVRLVRTPKVSAEMLRTETVTEVWPTDDGSVRCKRRATYYGLAAVTQRHRYGEDPAGEQRRKATAALQDSYSRARLVSFHVHEEGLRDHDKPVVVDAEFDIPKHFTGKTSLEAAVSDSATWSRLLGYNIDYARQTDMVLPAAFVSSHTWRVHLPPGWTWDDEPTDKDLKSKWGSFSRVAKRVPGKSKRPVMEVKYVTRVDKTRIAWAQLDDFRDWYDKVRDVYRAWLTMKPGSSPKAREELEELLAVSPQNSAAAKSLAKLYINANRLADAWRVLEKASHYSPADEALWDLKVETAPTREKEVEARRYLMLRKPKDLSLVLGLASSMISAGDQAGARKLLDDVIAKGKPEEKGRAHFQYARSHYRKDELKQALEHIDEAAKADGYWAENLRALRLKGQALDELKRPKEALAVFEKAYTKDRGNRWLLVSIIRVGLAAGDKMTALAYLRRLAMYAEKDAGGLAEVAEWYYKLGRLDEAREAAMRSRDLNFHEKAQRVLGLIAYTRGDFRDAALHLDRADPDALVLAALLRSHLLGGTIDKVPATLDRIAKLASVPDVLKGMVAEAKGVLARKEEVAKHTKGNAGLAACAEHALRSGEPAARVEKLAGGDDPLSMAVRGKLALERGKLREANALAESALKAWPGLELARLVRGRVRLEREQAGAADDLTAGVAWTGRKDAEALRALAEALEMAGKMAEAVKVAREALALRPKDRGLAELVERLTKKNAG
jgi:predicted Zn-dependent protease